MPEMTEVPHVKSVAHGMFQGADELLNVLFDVVVPIIVGVAGIFCARVLGLSATFHLVFGEANISGFSNTAAEGLVDGVLASVIWGSVAVSLWRAQKRVSDGARWVLRPIAAFFGGLSAGELILGVTNNIGTGPQWIATAVYELSQAAGGSPP